MRGRGEEDRWRRGKSIIKPSIAVRTFFYICVVLYDLVQRTMEVFVGNPAWEKPVMQFSMTTAQSTNGTGDQSQ